MDSPLVSIIIPTFNRAHLIGETLDSILAQSYTNWECIVVDDGSSDDTDRVMAGYCTLDNRIKYYHRPDSHLPGGNGARNYGLELATGEYIQWFDSDDLMSPDKLEKSVMALSEKGIDFVISKNRPLNSPEEANYSFEEKDIDFLSFATAGPVTWLTSDLMLKRTITKKLSFNEKIKAGQEYNYICKLLLNTNSCKIIDSYTIRRITPDSIGTNRRKDPITYHCSRFETYWQNFLELSELTDHKQFLKYTLLVCISSYLRIYPSIQRPPSFRSSLTRVYGICVVLFVLAETSVRFTGRFHFFLKRLKTC